MERRHSEIDIPQRMTPEAAHYTINVMSSFHILNFGCRASQSDGAALKLQLLQAGFTEAETPERSEIAVLNTCTVTAAADAEVRQTIRRIHRNNPNCRVLVTGCYAQRAPAEIAAIEGVTWVVGNSHKHQVAQIVQGAPDPSDAASAPRAAASVGPIGPEFHFLPAFPDDRTRPTLKVQDGCSARCAFCIIPTVRGRSRSLSPDRVIAEVRRLEAEGYKEIVLSGINLGSYGKDLSPRTTFLALLERILAQTPIARVRISSIEPMDVRPALIQLAASNPRIAEHFHVPLQSGADRILRQMNRRYWPSQYAERVLAIREALPHAGIGADVMTGFPGETDEEHAASTRFIESLPFTYLHVFPYSARPGTPAAARADQVNGRIAHERAAELRAVVHPKRRRFMEAQVGRILNVLTLHGAGEGEPAAMSSNYLKVMLPGAATVPNRMVNVRAHRIHEGALYGQLDA